MKNRTTLSIILAAIFSLVIMGHGLAETLGVDATRLKQLSTDKAPLDVETSTDGKLMFVLVPGEVLIFSDFGDRPVNRIAVDKKFDRMTFAEKLDLLILSSKFLRTKSARSRRIVSALTSGQSCWYSRLVMRPLSAR